MSDCIKKPDGTFCPPESDWKNCRPWDLTEQSRMNCYIDSLTQESLNIAGAHVNVFKMLGVHEQSKLVDLTGDGVPISGGDAKGFKAINAFETYLTEWKSRQTGVTVTSTAYIGYDFGVIKLPTGRQRYGVDASIRQLITALKIKQSADPNGRVTKARVERSDNGVDWFGVAIVTLPNNDALNTIHFKKTSPARYWRLRPITFVGADCDAWGVQALELYDFTVTHISNIQDPILLENRDRDYQQTPVLLRGFYEIQSLAFDLTRFGGENSPVTYSIKVNFNACVALLGRPIVVGDIIELPSEVQYSPTLEPVKKFLEVKDVTWDATSYTPGWMPTMLMISAEPALASQETQSIYGDMSNQYVDNSGLFGTMTGGVAGAVSQDFSDISRTIAAESAKLVPERGSEGSNTIREFSPEELATATTQGFPHLNRTGLNANGTYVEDAMPKNGKPYTEGPTWPANPSNGDYHRMTYQGLAKDIPARLYRWSDKKSSWVYLQTDRRAEMNATQPKLQEYTRQADKKFASEIK